MKSNRFAVLPWRILESKDITASEKLLCAIINSLSQEHGYSWASNEYLASIMASDERRIRRLIEHLEEVGYIIREYVLMPDGQKRRYLSIRMDFPLTSEAALKVESTSEGEGKNYPGGRVKFTRGGEGQNYPPNNKEIITSNNLTNKKRNIKGGSLVFDSLWEIYGKRGGKSVAYSSWQRLSPEDQEIVKENIPKYIEHHEAAEKCEFIPHMVTYLNQRRWESALPYESKIVQSNPWSQVKW